MRHPFATVVSCATHITFTLRKTNVYALTAAATANSLQYVPVAAAAATAQANSLLRQVAWSSWYRMQRVETRPFFTYVPNNVCVARQLPRPILRVYTSASFRETGWDAPS